MRLLLPLVFRALFISTLLSGVPYLQPIPSSTYNLAAPPHCLFWGHADKFSSSVSSSCVQPGLQQHFLCSQQTCGFVLHSWRSYRYCSSHQWNHLVFPVVKADSHLLNATQLYIIKVLPNYVPMPSMPTNNERLSGTQHWVSSGVNSLRSYNSHITLDTDRKGIFMRLFCNQTWAHPGQTSSPHRSYITMLARC